MTYEEAEQRLKELLKTGFLVDVEFEEDLSLKVEKLLHSLYSKDNNLFQVGEAWEDGVFEEEGFEDTWVAGMWRYFGIVNGVTYLCDEPNFDPVLLPQELEEIVTAFVNGSENTAESKFEAVSGDQSLFDLVKATDEHLYIVRNAKHTGIYATEHSVTKDRILAERKLKEPEFIRYHTDTYLHEDEEFDGVDITAFRDRSGNACINVSCNPGNVEVVLNKEMTVLFANELLAIANGVERKE